jgi:hypothetical protein
MGTNADFIASMDAQLKKWDQDMQTLRDQGKTMAADARTAYFTRIKELHANRATAQKAFQELRLASDSAGFQLQVGMQSAWETMKSALDKLALESPK